MAIEASRSGAAEAAARARGALEEATHPLIGGGGIPQQVPGGDPFGAMGEELETLPSGPGPSAGRTRATTHPFPASSVGRFADETWSMSGMQGSSGDTHSSRTSERPESPESAAGGDATLLPLDEAERYLEARGMKMNPAPNWLEKPHWTPREAPDGEGPFKDAQGRTLADLVAEQKEKYRIYVGKHNAYLGTEMKAGRGNIRVFSEARKELDRRQDYVRDQYLFQREQFKAGRQLTVAERPLKYLETEWTLTMGGRKFDFFNGHRQEIAEIKSFYEQKEAEVQEYLTQEHTQGAALAFKKERQAEYDDKVDRIINQAKNRRERLLRGAQIVAGLAGSAGVVTTIVISLDKALGHMNVSRTPPAATDEKMSDERHH